MKKVKIAVLIGSSLLGGVAYADYQCVDYSNEISMPVNEHHITHLGNTSILLASDQGKTYYFGNIQTDDGLLLKKKVVELYPYQGDTLTIVSKPKSCGRGSCDFEANPIITAKLKIGEIQTNFSCDEINP